MFTNVEKQQLKVPAHIDYLGDLRDFVTQLGHKHRFSDKVVNAFKLSVDEAATNIMRHAYRDQEGLITIRAVVKKNSLTISIVDQGTYFDPNRVEDPDLNKYIDIGKKGGLGIFIMRKLMDEIEYRKTEEGNELRITKYRDQPEKKSIIKTAVSSIPFSIKAKYFFRAIGIIFGIIVLGYLWLFLKLEKEVFADFLVSSRKIHSAVVNRIVDELDTTPYFDPSFIFPLEQEYREIKKIVAVDSAGFVEYSSDTTDMMIGEFRRPAGSERLGVGLHKYKTDDGELVYEFEDPIVLRNSGVLFGRTHIVFSAELAVAEVSSRRIAYLEMALVILALSCAGVTLLIYLVMNPFRKLSDWVKNIGHGELEDEMDIDASTEIGEIAKAFSDITHKFRDSQKNLAQQERLQREMQVAKDIQQTLLPMEFPELDGYQVSAHHEMATEVGGDYYDFVEVDKDTLGIVVADVSGKGVPGSLVMTMIRTALRTEARGVKDAAEVLSRVNDFVSNDIRKGMFVTVFYLIIDAKKRSLNYASAGHNPMIIYRSSTEQTYYLNPKGFPIGVKLPEKDYFRNYIVSDTIRLAKDDILLLYTDGITEAMNSKRELFGEERLQKVMSDYGALSATDFVDRLKDGIYSFTEGTPQSDDITLVAIKEESTREQEELRRAVQVYRLTSSGASMKDACEEVNLTTYAFNKYKKMFEVDGVEQYETMESTADDSVSVEVKHLSIQQRTKIFAVIESFPEYGASRIRDELNTETYNFTQISERKIYDELVKSRLNTKALREAHISRAKKSKRRLKAPGTPLMTLDGEVVLRKVEAADYTLPEAGVRQTPVSRGDTAPANEHADNPASGISDPDERLDGGVEETLLEDEILIGGTLDEILANPGPQDQEIPYSSEEDTEVEFDEPEPSESFQAAEDLDDLSGVDDSSLLDDFSFEELFDSQAESGDEDFEAIDEEPLDSGSTASAQEDDASEPMQESEASSEAEASEPWTSVEHERESEPPSTTVSVDDSLDSEPSDEQPSPLAAAESEADTVSFSDLIQAIDDEIVYVAKPPEDRHTFNSDEERQGPNSSQAAESFVQPNGGVTGSSVRKADTDRETVLISGIRHYKNNDYHRAIEEFKKVIDVFPDYKEAHSILGNAYFRNRMYNEAVVEYQRVKEIDPSDVTAYENMGVIYANRGKYREALGEWKRVMELSPDRTDIKDKIKKALRMID